MGSWSWCIYNKQLVSAGDQLRKQCLCHVCPPSSSCSFLLMLQDHWKPVDPYDNRRYYGNHYMQYLGQKAVSMDEVYHVLSTWPVCNKYTTYTTLMSPANFTLTGYDVYEWLIVIALWCVCVCVCVCVCMCACVHTNLCPFQPGWQCNFCNWCKPNYG